MGFTRINWFAKETISNEGEHEDEKSRRVSELRTWKVTPEKRVLKGTRAFGPNGCHHVSGHVLQLLHYVSREMPAKIQWVYHKDCQSIMDFTWSFKVFCLSGSLSDPRTRTHYLSVPPFHYRSCHGDRGASPKPGALGLTFLSSSTQASNSSCLWTFPEVYCHALFRLNILKGPLNVTVSLPDKHLQGADHTRCVRLSCVIILSFPPSLLSSFSSSLPSSFWCCEGSSSI